MLRQVYQKAANKIDFAPVLANFYLRMNQSSRADELFTQLLEQVGSPQEKARVYIHYGRFLASFNPQGAEAMFKKAIATDPRLFSPGLSQAAGVGRSNQPRRPCRSCIRQLTRPTALDLDRADQIKAA